MPKLRRVIYFAVICTLLFFTNRINATSYETTEMRVYSIQDGERLCVKSPLLVDEHNIHLWDSFHGNTPLSPWPGIAMTQESGEIYCYTYNKVDDTPYDYVLFNGNSKQTIDLSVINDSKGIVKSYLYKFDETGITNENKYVGAWHIYDTSKLVELVAAANNINQQEYTISSYNDLKMAIGDKVEPSVVTEDNQGDYNLGAYYLSKLNDANDILNKLVVQYSSNENRYTALYIDKYNELASSLNNLKKRKTIVVDSNIQNGVISANYGSNTDSNIVINANPNNGYRLKNLKVSKILSYDTNNNPVLGEETQIDITNPPYNYSISQDDDIVGVLVSGEFKKNQYNLTFQVGENGSISTTDGGEVLSPVTVEYDDNYSLKITANEGYKVNKVLVDGEEYTLSNGILTIENVRKNMDISISFSIITCRITYGSDEYTVNYGTTYSELMNIINTAKTGYKLNYIVDKNGTTLTDSFVVTEDNVLVGNYSKNQYKLTFQVGENGFISTLTDGEILSPVIVEYDDDYNLKIRVNEGYEVDKVLVDGVEYELTNDVLRISNIKKDTNVEISFKLKMYNIKIDDKTYRFAYGTTYDEIIRYINIEKEGYKFKGLANKSGRTLDSSYIVTEDAELKTVFDEIRDNPTTIDSIVKDVIVFVISMLLFTFVAYSILNKYKKARN